MPAGETTTPVRVREGEGLSVDLDQVRANSVSVEADQRLYAEAQARYMEYIRPPSFEECLKSDHDMEPQPLTDQEISSMSTEAVEVLARAKTEAGGRPQESEPVVIPEPGLDPEPTAGTDSEVVVEEPIPPQLPPPGMVDFYEYAQRLEERIGKRMDAGLSEVNGAIIGLGMRIERVAMTIPSGSSSHDSSPKEKEVGSPPSVAQAIPVVQPRAASVQERRLERHGGSSPAAGGGMAPNPECPEPVAVSGGEPSARKREGGSRLRKPSIWAWGALGGIAAAGVLVVVLAGQSSAPIGLSEEALAERQTMGLGAYVRGEEAVLCQQAARIQGLTREATRIREEMKGGLQDVAAAQRRLQEVETSLDRARRADRALQVLAEVSGVEVRSGNGDTRGNLSTN